MQPSALKSKRLECSRTRPQAAKWANVKESWV